MRARAGKRGRARRPRRSGLRFFRRVAPSTVTKLGQKPLRQEKSLLQVERLIWRLRPNGVSFGSTLRQFDSTEQSPQPSQTSSLIQAKRLRVGHLSALAPAPLLRRAVLLVDQHRDAGDSRSSRCTASSSSRGWIVTPTEDRRRAIFAGSSGTSAIRATPSARTCGRWRDADRPVDGLAAGHRDRIVEQDLVGDVGLGRDRLPDRHRARMIIGAFAEVLENVLAAGERATRRPS